MELSIPLKDDQPTMKRSGSMASHGSSANLQTMAQGEEDTLEFRIQAHEKEGITAGKKSVSLWHDITLVHIDPITEMPTPYLNFVCEIPKFSR